MSFFAMNVPGFVPKSLQNFIAKIPTALGIIARVRFLVLFGVATVPRRKLEKLMFYVASRKGWTKQYKPPGGVMRTWSVSCKQLGCPVGEAASVLQANAWWERKKAELDLEAAEANGPSPLARAAAVLDGQAGERAEAVARAEAARRLDILAMLANGNDYSPERILEQAKVSSSSEEFLATILSGREAPILDQIAEVQAEFQPADDHPQEREALTVRCQANQWLTFLRAQVAVDQLSTGRYDSYARQLKPFVEFLGPDKEVSTITAERFEGYWLDLARRVADRNLAQATVKGFWMAAKQWVKWLAERGKLILPGNVASRRLKFTESPKKIETLPLAYVQALLKGCEDYKGKCTTPQKTKLYLLLMLNCGMYQNDVAELAVDEVDWKEGKITRPRSKKPDGLITKYKLWPETWQLLQEYGNRKSKVAGPRGPRVLSSARGTPLVLETLKAEGKEGGKATRYDLIKDAYHGLCKTMEVERKPLKLIRKTSSTALGTHTAYKFYADIFLAHMPTTMSGRHYTNFSQAEFEQATDWLRTYLLGK